MKLINWPQRLESEYKTLRKIEAKNLISPGALKRLEKLKILLKDPLKLKKSQENDLNKLIPDALRQASLEALDYKLGKIYTDHWRKISTRPVENWDEDWDNALRLYFTTDHNKRLLKRLMINAAGGDYQWIYYHSDNINFLRKNKVSRQHWIEPMSFSIDYASKVYNISAEKNLLKILQMGNIFGSCLSVGGFNSFSTIANAVEVNKHVLWCKDKQERIIGRKLLVLSPSGKLYGFNSYGAALDEENSQHWIKIAFDLFCLQLVKKAGIEMSNERDDEEKLGVFAHWYDDGIELFDWWILELQLGKTQRDIFETLSKKNKPDLQADLRAALWLNHQGMVLPKHWKLANSFCERGEHQLKKVKKIHSKK